MLRLYRVHGVLQAAADFPDFEVQSCGLTPSPRAKLLVTGPEDERFEKEPADEFLGSVNMNVRNLVALEHQRGLRIVERINLMLR